MFPSESLTTCYQYHLLKMSKQPQDHLSILCYWQHLIEETTVHSETCLIKSGFNAVYSAVERIKIDWSVVVFHRIWV